MDGLIEEKVRQYEVTAQHRTMLPRSKPLFDTATTIVTTTDDILHTSFGGAATTTTISTNTIDNVGLDRIQLPTIPSDKTSYIIMET
jgi:hypothetical protein